MTRAVILLGKTYDEVLDGYTLPQLLLIDRVDAADRAAADARALTVAATAASCDDTAVKKLQRKLNHAANQ